MAQSFSQVVDNGQNGYVNTSTGAYAGATPATSISMVVGQSIVWRFPTYLPLGAVVTSAVVSLPFRVKFTTTDQSATHTVSLQDSGNAQGLIDNESTFSVRSATASTTSFTTTYTSGTNTYSSSAVDVTTQVNAILARGDYVPGAYMVVFAQCTAESGDMSFSTQAEPFTGVPNLTINYTAPSNPIDFWDFNMLINGNFYADTFGWFENSLFGANTLGGTIANDASFTRAGRPTLKYTTPAADGTKSCGIYSNIAMAANTSYIFSGFIYIPSSLTGTVEPAWVFEGNPVVTERDTWVPFCTNPRMTGSSPESRFVGINVGSFVAGQNFWLSDCTVYESSFRQTSWSAYSPSKGGLTQGGLSVVSTASRDDSAIRGTHVRRTVPRLRHHNGTLLKAKMEYVNNADGIWRPATNNVI